MEMKSNAYFHQAAAGVASHGADMGSCRETGARECFPSFQKRAKTTTLETTSGK